MRVDVVCIGVFPGMKGVEDKFILGFGECLVVGFGAVGFREGDNIGTRVDVGSQLGLRRRMGNCFWMVRFGVEVEAMDLGLGLGLIASEVRFWEFDASAGGRLVVVLILQRGGDIQFVLEVLALLVGALGDAISSDLTIVNSFCGRGKWVMESKIAKSLLC